MGDWWVVSFQVGVLALVAARPLTAGRPDPVRAWAAAQGLRLSEENEPVVVASLTRTARWRLAGAAGGLVVGVAGIGLFGGNVDFGVLVAVVVGYMSGVLVGALTAPSGPQGLSRRASLSPRRLVDYVPPSTLRWLYVASAGTVAAAVTFLVAPRENSWVGPVDTVVVAMVAVGVAIAARVVAEVLVRRRQPVASALLVATDDALRSAGVRAVLASATAVALIALSAELFALASTEVVAFRWTMWLPALLAAGFAWGAWRALSAPNRSGVRRRLEPRPGAA